MELVLHKHQIPAHLMRFFQPIDHKPKDLMNIPAMVAEALRRQGWYLRSDIIWCKRAPMPESVTDRPTSAHEHVFLLSKSERYFYDADAVRETGADSSREREQYAKKSSPKDMALREIGGNHINPDTAGKSYWRPLRNLWNYWLLSPEPYPESHFAVFPTEIPRRAILAGTSEHGVCAECGAPWKRIVERVANYGARQERSQPAWKGPQVDSSGWRPPIVTDRGWEPTCKHQAPIVPATVLDPFSGAGTTVMQALRLGRRGIGIELNPQYVEMSKRRIIEDAPLFNTLMEAIA